MFRLLVIFLSFFTGHFFGQTILQFKTSDLIKHKIDTLEISSTLFGQANAIYLTHNIKDDNFFVKTIHDTLIVKSKHYSTLRFTGLNNLTSDTLKIIFLKLNKTNLADTIIYHTEKRRLFTKTYRTTRQDTTIIASKYSGSSPSTNCELLVNNEVIIIKMSTLDSIDFEIGCNKRVSHSRQTRTHDIIYQYHFGH